MAVKTCPDCGGKVSMTRMDCPHCGYCFTETAEKIQCPECEEWVIKNEKGECPECGYCFGEEATTAFSELIDGLPDLGLDDASIEAAINQSNNILKMEPIPGMMKYKVMGCINKYVTEIVIPDVVYVIGKGAFKGLKHLEKVTISDSVQIIEDEAFADCPKLEITLPEDVDCGEDVIRGTKTDNNRIAREQAEARRIAKEEAERKAKEEAERIAKEEAKQEFKANFNYEKTEDGIKITSLKYEPKQAGRIVIPDFVTSIGKKVFYGCINLTSVTIPDSVTCIGEEAFFGCSSLTSLTIPDSVTGIDDDAFFGCSNLMSITIPDSVTSIGEWAFSGCNSLLSITVNAGNKVYHSAGNCLIETESKTLIAGCKNSVIPTDGSVTSISGGAFLGCIGLMSITIPDSVTSIGYKAFGTCFSLSSIIVNSGNKVYHGAGNCLIETESKTLIVGCKDSVIPTDGSVTSIGEVAFFNCGYLMSVTIPNSVTSIGDSAFEYCSSLTSITIPGSVTSIGDSAFEGCGSLKSVTISEGVTSIGVLTFSGCRGLTSVTIPDSVTSIGERAFLGCNWLSSVTIGNSVTSIGGGAFWGCNLLRWVTIPSSVTSIGDGAFPWRTLNRISFGGTKAAMEAITKNNHWASYQSEHYTIVCADGDFSFYY